MPIYEYQCDACGLRTEHLWRSMAATKDTIPCEVCSKDMRKLVSAASFKFNHKAGVRGSLPPSTGTSDDWNFDKAIGRDAERKWGAIEQRNSGKDAVIRHERKQGRAVSREQLVPKGDGTGEYRTITEGERKRANSARQTAFSVAQAAKKQSSGDK